LRSRFSVSSSSLAIDKTTCTTVAVCFFFGARVRAVVITSAAEVTVECAAVFGINFRDGVVATGLTGATLVFCDCRMCQTTKTVYDEAYEKKSGHAALFVGVIEKDDKMKTQAKGKQSSASISDEPAGRRTEHSTLDKY
jgi:hypothetical protein